MKSYICPSKIPKPLGTIRNCVQNNEGVCDLCKKGYTLSYYEFKCIAFSGNRKYLDERDKEWNICLPRYQLNESTGICDKIGIDFCDEWILCYSKL